jgi:hypothetical protein
VGVGQGSEAEVRRGGQLGQHRDCEGPQGLQGPRSKPNMAEEEATEPLALMVLGRYYAALRRLWHEIHDGERSNTGSRRVPSG